MFFFGGLPGYWHDDFASGVLSPRYQTGSGTWAIVDVGAGVKRLVNVPVLGAEGVTNGTFNTNLDNWNLTPATGIISWDTGAIKFVMGVSPMTAINQPTVPANTWIRYSVDLLEYSDYPYFAFKIGSTSGSNDYIQVLPLSGVGTPVGVVSPKNNTNPWITLALNGHGGTIVRADNVSAKPITTSHLYNSIRMVSHKVLASVGMTRAMPGTPQGLVVCLDDPANPLNYIHCRNDGFGNIVVEKILNNTVTPVLTHAFTYGAGKKIYVDVSALPTIKYGYDGVEFGTGTISDEVFIHNRYHGVFSTASGFAEGYLSDLTIQCY